MWPFHHYQRSPADIERIKALEREAERLCDEIAALKKERDELADYKRNRTRAKKQQAQGIKTFIGYKNYFRTPRRFWPRVLCEECASHKLVKAGKGWHCKLHNIPCSKFGSCQSATPKA